MSEINSAVVSRPRPWLRYFWISLLVLLILVVGVVGWMVYCATTTARQAEMNLHDTEFTIQLVEQFVHDKGQWPRSWAELEQLPFPSKTPSLLNVQYEAFRSWPAASQQLQECIAIDFQADPQQIAGQDPMKFDAIKPIGPSYPYRYHVSSLQKTLQLAIFKLFVATGIKEARERILVFPDKRKAETGSSGKPHVVPEDDHLSQWFAMRKAKRERFPLYSQVLGGDIDRAMILDAKMHEMKMRDALEKAKAILVSPPAPPSLEEKRRNPLL